jgi:hypothetical protein
MIYDLQSRNDSGTKGNDHHDLACGRLILDDSHTDRWVVSVFTLQQSMVLTAHTEGAYA